MGESLISFLSGGVAGMVIEVMFYPLDTLTTRIQSPKGLFATGGFRNLYKGIGSVTLISFPYSAVFLGTYESVKRLSENVLPHGSGTHVLSASLAEVAANLVRVPAEVIKQRAQAMNGHNSYSALLFTLKDEGFLGLYRGFQLTLSQDIPFSVIQLVLWEELKAYYSKRSGHETTPFESGVAGAIGGSIASFLTTPFDVARTRVVLASSNSDIVRASVLNAVIKIAKEHGLSTLFKGASLRVGGYSVGSLAFFYVYEEMLKLFSTVAK